MSQFSIDSIRSDPRKKIAIVGKAPSSLGLAPYEDSSWQIWTLSDLVFCKQSPKFDVHFELHATNQLAGPRKPYLDWLASITDKPVVVRECNDDIPFGVAYPKDYIVEKFGGYFTNSVSWMIALAIDMQPSEIGIWGVDMACNDEYAHQRPSCEYFLGVAAGRGIEVYVPSQSDLLKCSGLYGFDVRQSDMFSKWKTRCTELSGRVEKKGEERDTAERNVAFISGAIEYNKDESKAAGLQAELKRAEEIRDRAASESLYLQGALEDCRDYWGQWAQRT
jgi:hypothetical protein